MRGIFMAILPLAVLATPANAQSAVKLHSAVFVERAEPALGGGTVRKIEPASRLRKGDRVVMSVEWDAPRRGGGFTITSPVPGTVYFQRASERIPEVSADGGASWGKLGELRIGARRATPEDVTHIRWHVSRAQAAQGEGRFTYSAIVR